MASRTLRLADDIEAEAAGLIQLGIKPLDALHLELASSAGVEYFCTCDDKLLKKARRLKSLRTIVVTPLELIMKVAP